MKKNKLFLALIGLLTIGQLAFAQAGSTFSNSDTVTSLPFIVNGESTCGFGNNYSTIDIACSGNFMSGDEKIYSFTPQRNMNNIEVSVSNISDNFSGLFITDDSTASGTCFGAVADPSSNDRVISNLSLAAGTTYYVIVSTWANPQCIASYDIKILDQTCPAPDSLNIANLAATSVDVSWVETGSATQWTVEYGLQGFTPGSGTSLPNVSSPATISNLTGVTSYDFYVRSVCSASDSSYLVGPFTFTTPCLPTLAPNTESFDNPVIPNCWSNYSVTGGPWQFNGTPGYGASGAQDHTGNGGNFIWMDFSGNDVGVSLETGDYDVSALTTPFLEFFFYTNNTNNNSINDLMVEAWDGSSWSLIDSIHQNLGGWTKFGYNVAAHVYGNNLVRFRFRAESGGDITDYNQDFLLDDITVMEIPSCPDPSSLAAVPVGQSADVFWTEQGSATNWEIEWDVAGFTPGTGNILPTATNPTTITGLTVTTNYEYYVRSLCGAGDSSLWVGPFAFTTTPLCPEPVQLSANVSLNTAVLNWTEIGSAGLWEYEYGIGGFAQGTGTMDTTSADSASISSLNFSSTYQFYVRAICGPGDTSAWAGPSSFVTPCAVVTAPMFESFNSNSTPTCWVQTAATGGPWQFPGFPGWGATGVSDHTGNGGNFATMDFSGTDDSVCISTVEVDVSALTVPYLEFYFYTNNTNDGTLNELYLEAWNGTSWGVIDTIIENTGGWSQKTYDLSAYTYGASLVQVRFRAEPGAGTPFYHDLIFDDVSITEMPTCPKPSQLSVSNGTLNSMDISWIEMGSATTWAFQYDTAGFTFGSGIDSITTINPLTINGLIAGTNYEFYLRSICGAGDSSLWAGPFSFTTLPDYCAGSNFYDNGGPTGNYANSSNDTTVICANTPGDIVEVTFNAFNLENNFDYLYIYDGDNTSAALLGVFSGTTIPGPFLAGSTSGCLTFVFTSDGSVARSGWDASILCIPPPTCPAPINLTINGSNSNSANLAWTEQGSATQWEVEYGVAPYTLGSSAGVLTTTNPHVITGLSATTNYQFFVRSVCAAGDSSSWSGPFAFTTPCVSAVTPFLDDVETHVNTGNGSIANCWSSTPSGPNFDFRWNVNGPGGTGSTNTGPSGAFSGAKYFYTEASSGLPGAVAELISPNIDVTSLTIPTLQFRYHMFGATIDRLIIDVYNNGAWINGVDSIVGQQQTADSDPWRLRSIYLNGYTGDVVARFRVIRGGSFTGDVALDDIAIVEAPSCIEPTLVSTQNITTTSADITWTAVGTASQWEIAYDDSIGFILGSGTGTSVLTSTNPYALTGLTASTDYEYYLRSICGPGDTSIWAGPFSFTTPCSVINTFPFTESFDISSPTIGCWLNEYEVGVADWSLGQGALGGAITAPYVGGYNLRFVSQFGTNDPITNAISPTFDITGLVAPRMHFAYAQEEAFGSQNYLRVLYRTGPTDPWVELWSDSSNVDDWTVVTLNLPNPSANYQLAFQGINNGGRRNVVDEMIVEDTPANDLMVTNVTSVGSNCGLGVDSIRATVVNNGSVDQSNFSLGYTMDGVAITPEVVTTTIAAFDTMVYTFSSLANFATPGAVNFEAYSILAGDIDLSNDTVVGTISKTIFVDSYPYMETFAAGQQGWEIDNNQNGSWAFGNPNKPSIVGAASDTNAFVTGGLTGNYNASELAYVYSPCFDFTVLNDPYVQMSVWYESESNWDGGQIQYSTDGGDTWTILGELGSGENWYTGTLNGLNSTEGWAGRNGTGSNGWKTATISATDLAGLPDVKFRVAFGSDFSVQDEGFGFDDFAVFNGSTLGADTTLCTNETLTLDPGTYSGGYLWNDSSITPLYFIDAAVRPEGVDTISVIVSGPGGFKMFDTVVVGVEKPVVTLGNDTVLCFGESIVLTADAGFASYLWSNSDTSQSTSTDGSLVGGTDYSVLVNTANGCPAIDSINVNVNTEVLVDLGADTMLYDSLLQDVTYKLDAGPGFSSYLWSDGSTNQTLVVDSNQIDTIYTVVVTNSDGCEGSDTVNVVINLSVDGGLTVSTISMYPNPTTDIINISVSNFAALGDVELKVLDITGKVVMKETLQGAGAEFNETYDVSRLASGTYFVQFEAQGEVVTRQFVIK